MGDWKKQLQEVLPHVPPQPVGKAGGRYRRWVQRRRDRLYEVGGGRCHYCECELSREAMTIDHVIPLAKGGPNSQDNMVIACRACNEAKGDSM